MGDKRTSSRAVQKISRWVRSRSVREKLGMGAVAAFILFVFLRVFIKKADHLFFVAQIAHSTGLFLLIYKLTINKSCAGLSLKTQELTAIFLTIRVICSVVYRGDIHIVLDSLTLLATLWVIYMMRFKLKSTYMKDLDTMPLYYVLVPCAIVALIGLPGWTLVSFFWVYQMTVEAISVLPQLRLIQNAKMVEPFTAHYVFALGVARFLLCAHWINLLISSGGAIITQIGHGHLWVLVALLCEVVQTFILADFCYYYVKSVVEGQRMMRLPSLV